MINATPAYLSQEKSDELQAELHRLKMIESAGIDVCIVIKFNSRFARLGAEYFVKNFLIDKLGMLKFIVGAGAT